MSQLTANTTRIRVILASEGEAKSLAAAIAIFVPGTRIELEAMFIDELRLAHRLPIRNFVSFSGEPISLSDLEIDNALEREALRCRRVFERQFRGNPVRWISALADQVDTSRQPDSGEIVAISAARTFAGRPATKALEAALAAGKAALIVPPVAQPSHKAITILGTADRPSDRAISMGRALSPPGVPEPEWVNASMAAIMTMITDQGRSGLHIVEISAGDLDRDVVDRLFSTLAVPVIFVERTR